jgi:hypothetical protein
LSFSRFVFIALPVLLAPIVYGSVYSSNYGFEACAVPPDPNRLNGQCLFISTPSGDVSKCCWEEDDLYNPGKKVFWCQNCATNRNTGETDCNPIESYDFGFPKPTPPLSPGGVPPDGGVGPVGPNILPFDLRDILNFPENASFSIGVRHGPISDTIMIEIPKALSSSILNQTATGFEIPKALSSSILNQTNVNQTATSVK